MDKRYQLHEHLLNILQHNNVYFQPPASCRMRYPAIVYGLNGIDKKTANNSAYMLRTKYQITLIDENPDNEYVMTIAELPNCKHDRRYQADNLYHDVFTIYY